MNIYFHCFGDIDSSGKSISSLGADQIRAAARAHLAQTKFDLAIHSGMTRAREIARLALATLGQTQTGVPMIEDVSFGFAWLIRDKPPLYQFNAELSDVPGLPSVADRPRIKTLREAGLRWPRLTALGYRVEAAMKAHTVDLAVQYPEKKQMDVLVASHSLCVEMAAYPEFRILKPGEMIRYQLSAMPVMRANIERLPAPALPATTDA